MFHQDAWTSVAFAGLPAAWLLKRNVCSSCSTAENAGKNVIIETAFGTSGEQSNADRSSVMTWTGSNAAWLRGRSGQMKLRKTLAIMPFTVATVLLDRPEHPLPEAQRAGQPRAHVLELQLRIAHGVLEVRDEVLAQLEVLADLHRRDLEALVVGALRRRGHAARLGRAVLALVDDRADPGDQLALVEDGQQAALVGVVDVAEARVVVHEDVAVAHADRGLVLPVLEDVLDRRRGEHREQQHAAGRGDRQIAAGGE